jgi:transposase InsO family protein
MPTHMLWAVVRRRQEWFRLAERRGVHYTSLYFGISRKTYYKWWNRYRAAGFDPAALQDRSRRPKTHPKTSSQEVVNTVIRLRRHTSYGPRRLQFFLARDHGLRLSVCGVYKILDRAGCIQRQARKKKRFQSYAAYIHTPGQKVQVDVKYVPWQPGQPRTHRLYQYSAKDLFTKLRFIRVYDELTAQNTVDFARRCLRFFPFPIRCFQTDHGIEFTFAFLDTPKEHPFDTFCRQFKIVHKLIPVATPRYNGQVERGHRTDMEEFYRRASFSDQKGLSPKILRYQRYYNEHRPHMAIDMLTPLQKLRSVSGFKNAQLNYRCTYD